MRTTCPAECGRSQVAPAAMPRHHPCILIRSALTALGPLLLCDQTLVLITT